MINSITASWRNSLNSEFEKPYFKGLEEFVNRAYEKGNVYPAQDVLFKALNKCSLKEVKVVIIGQDPYHGENQANGLCFSVNNGVKIPPSLANIFKELKSDIGKEISTDGDLEYWTKQGVLMLNATLTVEAKSPGSHQNVGWEQLTDAIIKLISENKSNVVFLLWGNYAQKKGQIIDVNRHFVLKSPHPSPFSAHKGFLGNKHFSKTNTYLKSIGKPEINW